MKWFRNIYESRRESLQPIFQDVSLAPPHEELSPFPALVDKRTRAPKFFTGRHEKALGEFVFHIDAICSDLSERQLTLAVSRETPSC